MTEKFFKLIDFEERIILNIRSRDAQLYNSDNFLHCPEDWRKEGIYCYRFFNLRHSWRRAAQICRRAEDI
ncbi:hypothetical protein QR98_0002110 [Sarcoptes scabiei]|uniref:C-type lectin domain-containing protein n=1 Tax=Sarcoptes scabiei TaxID=52283 RepID=A0A131ZTD5_SARSC|nr:hypothetical protein QR98_0002110 [Sarcoptes scabiei]